MKTDPANRTQAKALPNLDIDRALAASIMNGIEDFAEVILHYPCGALKAHLICHLKDFRAVVLRRVWVEPKSGFLLGSYSATNNSTLIAQACCYLLTGDQEARKHVVTTEDVGLLAPSYKCPLPLIRPAMYPIHPLDTGFSLHEAKEKGE